MTDPARPVDPFTTPVAVPPQVDDSVAVRASAQWIVTVAGAVGVTLVAGFQIGDFSRLLSDRWALAVAVLAFSLAMWMVTRVIRTAARVLVVGKATISDLLREENRQRVQARGTITIEDDLPFPGLDPDLSLVHRQILRDQAWLLPGDESVAELFTRYEAARRRADDPAGGDAVAAAAHAAELSGRLHTVCLFARSVLTRMAYQRLCDTITGWRWLVFVVAVVVMVVALGWPDPEPPRVTTAYRLDVLLTGDRAALRDTGLGRECLTGTRLTGVALGGDLTEPDVVTEALTTSVDGRPSTCGPARFTVTEKVGIPIPHITP